MKDSIFLNNILDYPDINDILDLKAWFQAYDKGDNCVMFTVVSESETPLAEISIYGYSQSFFDENNVSDLLTEQSECIVIAEHYQEGGKMYVWNKELI